MYLIRAGKIFINLATSTDAIPGRATCYARGEGESQEKRYDVKGPAMAALEAEGFTRCKDVHKLTITMVSFDPDGKSRRIVLFDSVAVEVMKHLETLNQMA